MHFCQGLSFGEGLVHGLTPTTQATMNDRGGSAQGLEGGHYHGTEGRRQLVDTATGGEDEDLVAQ
jgi:hypothetical protein